MPYIKFVMNAVQVSLGAVYKNDTRLIENHCHELNIVGVFYHYFRSLFEEPLQAYCIDMECSRRVRNGMLGKRSSLSKKKLITKFNDWIFNDWMTKKGID